WRASRVSPADPLKDQAGTTTGRSRNELRLLVISELAVAMVLLMLTSLVALSTRNMLRFDYGFDDSVLLTIQAMTAPGGPDSTWASALHFENQLVQRLRTVPGVAAASLGGNGVFEDDQIATDETGNVPLPRKMMYQIAGPGFFATAGIPLIKGRDVTEGDGAGNGAIVLSQSAARLLFPHGGAIGRMVKLGPVHTNEPWIPVVGIAKDVNLGMSDDPTDLLNIYAELPSSAFPKLGESPTVLGLDILARAPHPSAELVHTIERDLQDALPADAGVRVSTWTSYRASIVRQNRFFERLLSMLSFSSLILGALGLFSVMSYSVGQRMREFAVRQALGATPRNIVRVVLTGAFELALGGTAIGALLSFWASAGISSQLFAVKNTDPVSLVIAEATLLIVAMVAAMVPAVRAMRADPVEILRST
ncbi:MAG TPA: FtsX-like permease family protein, partial [Gemmatimonadaceae bacterium]